MSEIIRKTVSKEWVIECETKDWQFKVVAFMAGPTKGEFHFSATLNATGVQRGIANLSYIQGQLLSERELKAMSDRFNNSWYYGITSVRLETLFDTTDDLFDSEQFVKGLLNALAEDVLEDPSAWDIDEPEEEEEEV